MLHRRLNHQRYTLAAIEDVIARGRWAAWAALRRAVLVDRRLLDRIEHVCRARLGDPEGSQRRRFWMHHVHDRRRRRAV